MIKRTGSVRDQLGDSTEFAAAYAYAQANAALRLLMDARVHVSADAAREVDLCDTLGGAFLESLTPVALEPDALSRALACIDALDDEPRVASQPQKAAAEAGRGVQEVLDLPEPVRDAALTAMEGADWRFAGRGIRILELLEDQGCKAELLRIEPGAGAPEHGHAGDEITLVLKGAFCVDGARFGRGDLCFATIGVDHRPVAEPGEVCIALAITDAPLEFKGLLGVLQRTFRRH